MIKKLFYLCVTLFFINGFSQVGIGTTNPNASSMLDITSTTSGILIPRMTVAQRNLIASPAIGLLIYQNDSTPGFYYYNGTAWTLFGSSGWSLTGNAATTPGTNFIGTTDGQDFVIKANGAEAMRVKNGGNVGIGNTNPSTKLHVEGTTTLPTSGTSTLYSNDFTSGSITSIAGAGNTCTTSPNIWTITATNAISSPCSTCTGNRANIEYSSSCVQNQMFKSTTFTPTTASIAISFKYSYDDFSSNDSFVVTLYNETTNTVAAALLSLTSDAISASYSTNATVVAGNSYSLRFTYIGNNDLGASVDTISITEAVTPTIGSYVFRLSDGTQAAGKVMISDANGNAYWGNGTGIYTFQNGLTNATNLVKLGGTLTETTLIGATNNDLTISTTGRANMMKIDHDENLVKFGYDFYPWDNGVAKTINGISTTVQYITSAYNGLNSGTTVGVGSLEYFTDGLSVIAASDSFLPITAGLNLGSDLSRWSTLYCTNTVNVSDANLKKNITPLNYGLKDLMMLKPVTYNWKDNKIGKTTIPENLEEKKLGFLAQDLLKVLPEVVKTHDWKITDESRPQEYSYEQNSVLGVMYSDIIPVVVKAVQEQQAQIEELKKTVAELKKQNELLLQLVNKK